MISDFQQSTRFPGDMSTGGLCETYLLYKELQSRSVRDEIYLSQLESEIERRSQYPFNKAVIDTFLLR